VIPKRVFFFWSGDKMSWLRYMTLYSFRKFHPDWEIDLYVSKTSNNPHTWSDFNQQDFFMYTGEDYTNKIQDLGINIIPFKLERPNHPKEDWTNLPANHESNFCRYLQLSKGGGVHADMDILFLKSLDPVLDKLNTEKIDVAISYTANYFSIGFMLACPNNPVFRDIFLNAFDTYQKNMYQGSGILTIHKKWKDLNALAAAYPNLRFYNLPMYLMYALNSFMIPQIFDVNYHEAITEKTYGLHWYAGNPLSQKYNNLLTENTYKNYDNTLTYFLKEVLR